MMLAYSKCQFVNMFIYEDIVGHSILLNSAKYLIHMQGWYVNTQKFFHNYTQFIQLIIGNLLQDGLCHALVDSKSYHDSYSVLKPLWKNSFVAVVYYELSFLVHDVMERYERIINALMLYLMSCDSVSYMSNWHRTFSKCKEVSKKKDSLLNFSNAPISRNSNMHSLGAAKWKQKYR